MTMAYADSETLNGWVGSISSYWTFSPRHNNRTRCNAVAVDGHVETLKIPYSVGNIAGFNRLNSELGYAHPMSNAGAVSGYNGPNYKLYVWPPGVTY